MRVLNTGLYGGNSVCSGIPLRKEEEGDSSRNQRPAISFYLGVTMKGPNGARVAVADCAGNFTGGYSLSPPGGRACGYYIRETEIRQEPAVCRSASQSELARRPI